MRTGRPWHSRSAPTVPLALTVATLLACGGGTPTPTARTDLTEFARRYAAAWSSQEPDSLASFYTEDGSLKVNDDTASVGRAAISATAAGFMKAFPDMAVIMDSVVAHGSDHAVFYWTWTGNNTGPGGTGREVRLRGYEEWTIAPNGLIAQSLGNYDQEEYQRQIAGEGQ